MECDRYPENGQGVASGALAWAGGVKRKLGAGGVRLGPAGAGGARAGLLAARRRPSPRPSPRAPLPRIAQDSPFMNNMDEITYWIVTKRAPCLAGYENPLRAAAPRALRSPSPDPEPKKKKRRLADDTSHTERPNHCFKPQPECEVLSSENSDTLVSDVDFNIKKSSVQAKNKKSKNKNNAQTALHKKNKVVTSTPKAKSNLRRSMRKANNNNSHLNSSFEIFNMNTVNGADHPTMSKCEPKKFMEKRLSALAGGNHINKLNSTPAPKPTNGELNGQFEDMSDVSGFTANYIKSTKINSKTPRKIRAKQSRNLAKESRHNAQKEEKSLIVSINKAVNTGDPKAIVLNCSTDSSQNIINLVSVEKDSKTIKLDKSTSLLKFMDTKKESTEINLKQENRNGINTSFQSTSTTASRYPKRHKAPTDVTTADNYEQTDPKQSLRRPANHSKSLGPIGIQSENTDILSRTRSGRSLRVTKHPENSVFVLSNSTEQVSSVVTMNVASPVQDGPRDSQKKKRLSSKCGRGRKSLNKTGLSNRDSFRERSGFAACFSDSDDDKPLKPQKYLS